MVGAGLLVPAPNGVAPGVGLDVGPPKRPAREVFVAAKAVAAVEAPAPKAEPVLVAPNPVAPPVGVEAPNAVDGFPKVEEGVEAAPKAVDVEAPKDVAPVAGFAPKVEVAPNPLDGVVEPKPVAEAPGVAGGPKVVPPGFDAANAAAGELVDAAVLEPAPNKVDPRLAVLAKLFEVELAPKPVAPPVAVVLNPLLAGCVAAPKPLLAG